MTFQVTISGRGRAAIAAYGVADAEHQAEKDLAGLWPRAAIQIVELRRPPSGRIVEEFDVGFTLRMTTVAEAPTAGAAGRSALRTARAAALATRYSRVEWDVPVVTALPEN